jgi:hypothetical protein
MDQTTSPLSSGGQCSEYFDVNIGVAQGDPLSTYLFHIFIDGLLERPTMQPLDTQIPLYLSSGNSPGSIATLTCADVVATLSLTSFGLHSHMNLILNWIIQIDKSKIMIFNPDKALVILACVMGGRKVVRVSTFEHLGVLFSDMGDIHTKHVLQHMNRAFGAWYPLFTCSKLRVLVRFMMVHTFVDSAVTFCSSSWEPTKAVGETCGGCYGTHSPVCNVQVTSEGRDWRDSVCGCRDASSIIDHTSFKVYVSQIQQLSEDGWISSKNKICFEGTRGVGRPRTGTNWYQSVVHIRSNKKQTNKYQFS